MALSTALATMSAQAKKVEEDFNAAQGAQRAKLEEQITRARASADQRRGAIQSRADEGKAEVSSWWRDLRDQWEKQTTKIRSSVADKREEHDAKFAAVRADAAEADAEFAIDMAQAAIEEAEYASLEAVLARAKADELASAH